MQQVMAEQISEIRNALELPTRDRAEVESRAAQLLSMFTPFCPLRREVEAAWSPEKVPKFELQATGPLVREEPDMRTFEIVELEVDFGDLTYGLGIEGCRTLDALAEYLTLHPFLRGLTTTEAMRDRLKKWCIVVLETNSYSSAVEHILKALRSEIDVHEAWVLLGDIDVEDSFPMGKVQICGIGSAQVEKWMSSLVAAGLDELRRPDIRQNFERKWQGHTAAVYRCIADKDATMSAALTHAVQACALLRMVEPGNVSATQRSYLQPEQITSQMAVSSVLLDPETLGHSVTSAPIFNPPCGIVIDRASFVEKWEYGHLRSLHELLSADPQTEFQRDLVASLMVYSRQRLTSDAIEKLIFAFSGLEAILVDPGIRVPKRFTLRKRLSGMFAANESVRQHIAQAVDRAYELRSNYLHEGIAIKDRQIVESFLQYAWLLFLRLVERQKRWRSVNDLRAELDKGFTSRFGEHSPADAP